MNETIPAKEVERNMAAEQLRSIRIVLLEAKDEIRQLRRTNEILRAKVEVMELFSPLIQTCFQRGQMMAPDITRGIENAVKAIDEAEMKANTKTE